MITSEEYTQQQLARIPAVESLPATFVSQSGAVAVVDQGGARLQVKSASPVACLPGDPVRLERRGADLVLVGPSAPRSVIGLVVTAGDPATVEFPAGSGQTATLPVAVGVTVSVGDLVLINWESFGLVVCQVAAPSSPTPPDAPPAASGQRLTQTFTAVDCGSYQGGNWWTREVWASTNNTGAWFYGAKIQDTIPDSAVIVSASMWLPARQNLYGAPQLGVHGSAGKPAGNVSWGALTSFAGDSGQVSIPTSWIDSMKVSGGGVVVKAGASYNIYRSLDADGNSGAITVTYQT